MSTLAKPMSLDEFLAWEERQELRYEYDGIAAQAMTGGTYAHALIQSNLMIAIGARLAGGPCAILGSALKVRTATSIRYPDALVHCSPIASEATFTPDPVVLFEILSPSSAVRDLSVKLVEYQNLPLLRRYVVLQQRAAAAEVFFKTEDDEWRDDFLDAERVLAMPEINIEVPLAEIYKGVELPRRA